MPADIVYRIPGCLMIVEHVLAYLQVLTYLADLEETFCLARFHIPYV